MIRLAIVLAVSGVVSSAAAITYDVDQTVGTGSVMGTIETDGTLGVIPANTYLTSPASIFLNWNLVLNDGTDPTVDLTPSNSELLLVGSDLSATANALSFNFANTDSGFFLFVGTADTQLEQWCGSSALICTENPPFLSSGSDLQIGSTEQFTSLDASSDIACIAAGCTPSSSGEEGSNPVGVPTPASTPEPSTVSFFGLGFAGLAFWKYRASRVSN